MEDTQVLTQQQIFDAVCEHMDKQRAPAVREGGGSCAYRTPDGKACAVGCLLSTDEAKIVSDNGHASASVSDLAYYKCLPQRLSNQLDFLDEMQRCHDAPSRMTGPEYMAAWQRRMRSAATEFSLSTTRLDAIEV